MNRIRKALSTALVGAALVAGGVVTAAPAQAATSTGFCFRFAETNYQYANHPVQLWSVDANGNRLSYLRAGQTGANGCATFYNTPANVRLRVFVHYTAGWRTFHGATPLLANPGYFSAHLGTGWVY
jgi:hypothetical protein